MRLAQCPPRGPFLLAIALIVVFAAQSFFSSRIKSPAFDEPTHIAAGLSYLETGTFTANRQHPPLIKEISAASLLLGGVHWPDTVEAQNLAQTGTSLVGNWIIAANGPDRVMFWARLPLILLAALLGVLIYSWGREILGEGAALGAVLLYALDPTMLAHSYLVATDVGVAAFGLLFVTALWRYVCRPAWNRLLFCGLTLGLALTAKFSAALLLPVAVLLVVASARWPFQPLAQHEADGGPRSRGVAVLVMCLVAVLVIQVVYFSPTGLASYVEGIQAVNTDHYSTYLVFMAGQLQHRFASYFLVAYLLKEPLAGLILVALGLFAVLRSASLTVLHKLFLLAPPVFLVAAYSLFADDMGIRYLIPALPFAFLLGGAGLAWLFSKSALWARGMAAVLCLWLAAAAAGIYPDHLSYFNEAACLAHPARIGWDGGTRCGPEWLDDSNVDWGQGLQQLKNWMANHGRGRPLRLAYFGSFPPDVYGLPNAKNEVQELATHVHPDAGLYAVSANYVARIPALAARESPGATHWLAYTQPVAIVGHSIYIYDIPR